MPVSIHWQATSNDRDLPTLAASLVLLAFTGDQFAHMAPQHPNISFRASSKSGEGDKLLYYNPLTQCMVGDLDFLSSLVKGKGIIRVLVFVSEGNARRLHQLLEEVDDFGGRLDLDDNGLVHFQFLIALMPGNQSSHEG